MMKTIIAFLLSQSILLPIIIGLVRFRRLDRSYQPFFILLIIGFITEIVGFILIQGYEKSNYVIVNIYVLIEWTLIAWQFHVWGFLQGRKGLFYAVMGFTTLCWVVENLVFGHITGIVPYFRFLYFFLIVLLSINKINFMITHDNRKLLQRPDFLICIGLIIFFLYKILYEWAYQVSITGESDITTTIIRLFGYINALTNIIFAIAFLLIPTPQKFTLRVGRTER